VITSVHKSKGSDDGIVRLEEVNIVGESLGEVPQVLGSVEGTTVKELSRTAKLEVLAKRHGWNVSSCVE